MKKWLIGILFLLSAVGAAHAQSLNPLPGYVWTYFGPTFGAGWGPSSALCAAIPGSLDQCLNINLTPAGTTSGAYSFNVVNCNGPEQVAIGGSGNFLVCVNLGMKSGGAGLTGGRETLQSYLEWDAPSNSLNNNRNYLPFQSQMNVKAGDGGAVTTTTGGPFTAGATAITVASITGILNGDTVYIQYDAPINNLGWYIGTVNGAPSGGTVTITPALPASVSVSAGRTLVDPKGAWFAIGGQVYQEAGSGPSIGGLAWQTTEFDAAMAAGNSALFQSAVTAVGQNGARGLIVDGLINAYSVEGSAGLSNVFNVVGNNVLKGVVFPVPGGGIIRGLGAGNAADFIDFHTFVCTNYYLWFGTYTVDCSGNVVATTAILGSLRVNGGSNFTPQTAPGNPATGWVSYTDNADGKFKIKASTGTTVTLGTP